MTSRAKAVTLALVAPIALGALAAPAAQAELSFTSSEYPATLTGEPISHKGTALHMITVGSTKIRCAAPTFSATLKDSSYGKEITVTSTYAECTTEPGNLTVTVTMNNCDYVLHGGEPFGNHRLVGVLVDLLCPPEVTGPVWHIYKAGKPVCTLTGTAFKNRGSVSFTDTSGAKEDVDMTTTVDLPITIDGSPSECGSGSVAHYTGAMTLRAYQDLGEGKEGSQVDLTAVEEAFNENGRLTGEQTEHGESASHLFTFGSRTLSCKTAKFTGGLESTEEEVSTMRFAAQYEECTSNPAGLPATVSMNGCEFVVHVGEQDEEDHFAGGTVDLLCPEGGPEAQIYSNKAAHEEGKVLCTLTIEPGEEQGEIAFENTTGSPAHVDLATTFELPAKRDGSILCGSPTVAVYTGATTMRAYEVNEGAEGEQVDLLVAD